MPITELLVGGLLLGGLYALMACGLNLIFGVMRVINFAHGELMAIGALSTVSLVAGYAFPFWLALCWCRCSPRRSACVIHRVVLQRLAHAPMIMSLLATYAISTILVERQPS